MPAILCISYNIYQMMMFLLKKSDYYLMNLLSVLWNFCRQVHLKMMAKDEAGKWCAYPRDRFRFVIPDLSCMLFR